MSKKLILFLMLAIFGSTSLLKADEVTIGDPAGTSTSTNFPVYSYYNYSFSQQIYTAEEIGTGGTINSLTMWLKNSTSYSRNVKIYMKNVEKNAFESMTDWVPMSEEEDLVATGTINNGVSTAQAVTFTLDTPFEYDDAYNLVVCFADVTGDYSMGVASVTFAGETLRALVRYRDSAAINVTDPTSGSTAYTASDVNRSVVRFDITTAAAAVTVTPAELYVEMPNNAWMEPAYVNVYNTFANGATVSTSYATYTDMFDNTTMLSNRELGYREGVDVEIKPAAGATGEFQSVLNVNYTGSREETVSAIINADFYTAAQPDVVEFAQAVIADTMNFAPDFSALHHNYNLPNAIEGGKDAVYTFTLAEARKFNATVIPGHIALYNVAQPKADNALMESATFGNVTLQAGTYYLIAESASAFDLFVTLSDFPPLTEAPVLLTPENGAMEVVAPATLTWTLPEEGVVEYRLLVNTVYALPEESSVVVDWTTDLATSYTLTDLLPATQYFWRVDARGANGEVMSSEKFVFTVAIPTPTNLEADDYTIFEGDDVELKWKGGAGGFEGEITVCEGTATNGYVPVYGLYADAYLKCNMVYPAEMLEEMEGGEITSMKFYIETPASAAWDPAHFVVYMMEVPGTTVSAFTEPENATVVYEGSLNGTGTEMVVTFDTPFEYGGGNLLVGINNTVIGTFKSCYFYGVEATGSCVQGYSYSSLSAITPTQRNFLPKTTFVCGGAKNTREFLGFNLYNNDVKVNSSIITEKKYTVSGLTYNMEGYNFAVTAVHSEGESAYSNIATVQVSGNGYADGHVYDLDGVTPLEDITVLFNGQDEFGDDVEYSVETNASGYYYTELKAGNYIAKTIHPEFTSVSADIVVEYAATTTKDFVIHEDYNPVGAVIAEEIDETMAKVSWSFGSMPGPGGEGDEFFFDFEDGFQGWTSIDADGDGYNWKQASTFLSGVYGHNGSADFVLSQSYDNNYGVLYPDNYIVSPQQYRIGGSSMFSIWACGQDASYSAEHFGVAISEAGNTDDADFTTVAEWTIGEKGGTAWKSSKRETVRGTRDQSAWIEYTVDLSAYAGKNVWIAVRHFNCYDEFYLDADDFSLYNADRGFTGDRSLQYYTVYRRQTLNVNGPVEEPVAEIINPTCYDTAYVDFNWGNMETGVYQYGVQVTYGGNHNPTRENDNIYLETFDVDGLTAWGNIDADGDGHLWELAAGHEGMGAKSVSWESSYKGSDAARRDNAAQKENGRGSYDPNNWLISPEITIPSTAGQEGPVQLSWYVKGGSSSYPEHYGVYVSTTGNQPADFTTQVYEGTSPASWTQLTVDLSAYIGQTVRVAFRHYDSYDKWNFVIDDVTVYEYEEPEPVVCDPITTFPYFNDFEDFNTNHDCWVSIDNDGDGYDWFTDTEAYWSYSFGVDGSHCLLSQSYDNNIGSRDADNYLLSPEFELPAGSTVTLSWYEQSQDGSYPDSYEVMVAPDGSTDISDFESIYSAVAANPWTERTADLSDYAGTTIRVVFHHQSYDCYFLEIDNLSITAEGGSDPDSPVTGIVWSNYLPKNMDMTLNLSVITNSNDDVRGAHATLTNVSEDYLGLVYDVELDSTGLYTFEDFRMGRYAVNIELAGFTPYVDTVEFWSDADHQVVLQEYFNPVNGLAVSSTGYAHWTAPTRSVEGYLVTVDGVGQGEVETTYSFLNTDNLAEGETYQVKVAAVYTTGVSAWKTANFTYSSCDNFDSGIDELTANANCMDVTFSWGGGTPTPPTPGEGDEFTEGFEGGLNGWNVLNVYADGGAWIHSDDNLGGYDYATLAHGGTGFAMCYSFVDYVGSFNTDSYLYTPQKYSIVNGSTLSFWADNANDSYPENFSVCVATADNPQDADFTQVWSGGAKGGNVEKAAVRHNAARYENWRHHTIDLSAYAGQQVYIAFHDVNYDAYEIWIDDVELTINGKGNRDGNWYYYDNGVNDNAIGLQASGGFYWGIMLPAGSYEGNILTKVSYFDYAAHTGTVSIYQGGTSAPQTLLHTQDYSVSGTSTLVEFEMEEAVEVDNTQPLWVVMHNNTGQYVAAIDAGPGVTYGSCISTDGSTWYTTISAASGGSLDGNWNLRAYIEAGSGPTPGPTSSTIEPNTWALFLDGEFIECVALSQTTYTLTMDDTEKHNFTVVKVDGDYNMSCGENVDFTAGMVSAPTNLAVVEAEDGVQLTWNGMAESYKVYRGTSAYDLVEIGTATETIYTDGFNGSCWYGVRAVAECGESDMDVVEYVSSSVNELDATTRIYPNPTKGDIRIEALGMRQIIIVNALGQTVYNQNVNADQMTIDMSQFGAGMYIVNIVTENGTCAKRISVAR